MSTRRTSARLRNAASEVPSSRTRSAKSEEAEKLSRSTKSATPVVEVVESKYPYKTIEGIPVSEEPVDISKLEEPASLRESNALYHSLALSRKHWVTGAMFEKYWTRPPRGKKLGAGEVNAREKMTKLCECRLAIGPHFFDVKLFIVKDESGDEKEDPELRHLQEQQEKLRLQQLEQERELQKYREQQAKLKPNAKQPSEGPASPSSQSAQSTPPGATGSSGPSGQLEGNNSNLSALDKDKQNEPQGVQIGQNESDKGDRAEAKQKESKQAETKQAESKQKDTTDHAAKKTDDSAPTNPEIEKPREGTTEKGSLKTGSTGENSSKSAGNETSKPTDGQKSEPAKTTPPTDEPEKERQVKSSETTEQNPKSAEPQASSSQKPIASKQSSDMSTPNNQIMILKLQAMARIEPSLNTLMRIVATGTASQEQVMTFQRYITKAREFDLADLQARASKAPPLPGQRPPPPPPPPKVPKPAPRVYTTKKSLKDIMIVFEFRDNPADRYVLPKDAIVEVLPSGQILLSTLLIHPPELAKKELPPEEPKKKSKRKGKQTEEDQPKPPVVYSAVTLAILDVPRRSVGVVERSVTKKEITVQRMEEILKSGIRSKQWQVWYQVDKGDKELIESLNEPVDQPGSVVPAKKREYKPRPRKVDADGNPIKKQKVKSEEPNEGSQNQEGAQQGSQTQEGAQEQQRAGVQAQEASEKPSENASAEGSAENTDKQVKEGSAQEPTENPQSETTAQEPAGSQAKESSAQKPTENTENSQASDKSAQGSSFADGPDKPEIKAEDTEEKTEDVTMGNTG
uniref:ARAD1A13530p n=1 Tax=Blastobotrys adeninivorans TaxID=409370 RepID=A0A060SY35_BLAAD